MKVMFALPAIFIALVIFSSATFNSLVAQDQATKTSQVQATEKEFQIQQTKAAQDTKKIYVAEPVFKVVDQAPEFPGGAKAFQTYLAQNIMYPEAAKQKGIQGTVFISFIIEKDGSVSDIKVLRGIDKSCDEEAVRVVKMMPKWKPGLNEGKPVRVAFNLPLKYKLEAKEKPEGDKK